LTEHKTVEQLLEMAGATSVSEVTESEDSTLPQYREWRKNEVDARGKKYKAVPGKRHFHLWKLMEVDGQRVTMQCIACTDTVILKDDSI